MPRILLETYPWLRGFVFLAFIAWLLVKRLEQPEPQPSPAMLEKAV